MQRSISGLALLSWLASGLAAPVSALAQGGSVPTTSETSPAWTQCRGAPGLSADAQIAGCTAVIESGQGAKESLAEAMRIRCRVLNQRGDRDAAIADCGRAIALVPDDPDAYLARATAYLNKGHDDHAIADYDQAIRLKPDSVGALTLRGMAYAHKGDYDRAIEDYNHALQLSPGFGMAAGGLREATQAKARLTGGQALGDPHSWCQGKALPQEGFAQDLQISGCTTLIQSGKEKRAGLAEDYFNRASAYDFAGDPGRAIADYGDVIRKTCASLGGKLHSFFFAFGDYDVVFIVELPDNAAAAALALATSAKGAISRFHTTVLLTPADGVDAMKKAQKVDYTPPA